MYDILFFIASKEWQRFIQYTCIYKFILFYFEMYTLFNHFECSYARIIAQRLSCEDIEVKNDAMEKPFSHDFATGLHTLSRNSPFV